MRTREQEVALARYLSPRQMAERLNVSVEYVKRLIRGGKIKAVSVGTAKRPMYRVAPDVFEAYLASIEVVPEEKVA